MNNSRRKESKENFPPLSSFEHHAVFTAKSYDEKTPAALLLFVLREA